MNYSVVRHLVACLLLAAAFAKGHQLATDSVLGTSLWNSRAFLVGLVLVELAFGFWLLFGLYPKWSRLGAMLLFLAFFELNLYLALNGEPCPCLGNLHASPWPMALLDLAVLTGLLVWAPGSQHEPSMESAPRRLYLFLALYACVALPALWSMVDYSPQGVMLGLRRDQRLQVQVGQETANPSSQDLAKILEDATRLSFTIDDRLLANQPNYGYWKMGKAWSVMLHMAEKQSLPARWDRTADGYHLAVAAGSTPWIVSGIGLAFVLAVFGLAALNKAPRASRVPREVKGT